MTTLEWVPVDDITRQAREVRPAATVLAWITALLFGLGWVLYKTWSVVWLAVAWSFVAIRQGWREAAGARQVTHDSG